VASSQIIPFVSIAVANRSSTIKVSPSSADPSAGNHSFGIKKGSYLKSYFSVSTAVRSIERPFLYRSMKVAKPWTSR
jgi:hypothetical protein